MKNHKLEMGKIYEVEYIDHYTSRDKSSQEAVFNDNMILKLYGVFVGSNPKYYIFSWNFAGKNFDDNDNMHVLKKDAIRIRKLKY